MDSKLRDFSQEIKALSETIHKAVSLDVHTEDNNVTFMPLKSTWESLANNPNDFDYQEIAVNKETTVIHFVTHKDWCMEKHFHLEKEVILVLQGRIKVLDHGNLEYKQGEVVIFQPKEKHEVCFDKGTEIIVLWSPKLK
jgi:quercetin dioxygenase-like cupin family protein